MFQHSILLPFYCKNCNHLAFIYRTEPQTEEVIEYAESCWRLHQCYSVKGAAIFGNTKDLSGISWGANQIPFDRNRQIKRLRSNHLRFGIITRLPQAEAKDDFIEILTTENNLILLRTVKHQDNLSAGMLLDLRQAEKVGNNKFRMTEAQQYLLHDFDTPENGIKSENLSLKLSAIDQEQLEKFLSQFTNELSKANLFPISIIPLKIDTSEEKTCYHREIILPPAYNLRKTIESMVIPDTIEIAIS